MDGRPTYITSIGAEGYEEFVTFLRFQGKF